MRTSLGSYLNLGVTGDGSPTVTAGPLFDLKFAIIQKKNNRVIAHLALGLKTTTGTPAWNNAVIATFPTGYISNISERYVALLGTPQNQGLVGFNANGDLTFKTNMISVGNGATSVQALNGYISIWNMMQFHN